MSDAVLLLTLISAAYVGAAVGRLMREDTAEEQRYKSGAVLVRVSVLNLILWWGGWFSCV